MVGGDWGKLELELVMKQLGEKSAEPGGGESRD